MNRSKWLLFGILAALLIGSLLVSKTLASLSDANNSSGNILPGSTNWATPSFYGLVTSPSAAATITYYYRVPFFIKNNGSTSYSATNPYPFKLNISLPAYKLYKGSATPTVNSASPIMDFYFTQGSSNTQVSYWIDPVSVRSSGSNIAAEVWLKTTLSAGAVGSYYMYYGYSNAATVYSSFATVFTGSYVFYKDDFESYTAGNTVTNWTVTSGTGTAKVQSTTDLRMGKYLDLLRTGSGTFAVQYKKGSNNFGSGGKYNIGFDVLPVQNNLEWDMEVRSGTTIAGWTDFTSSGNKIQYGQYNASYGLDFSPVYNYTLGIPYDMAMYQMNGTADTYSIDINGAPEVYQINTPSKFTTCDNLFFNLPTAGSSGELYVDNVRITIYDTNVYLVTSSAGTTPMNQNTVIDDTNEQ